jgi:hypothetical protein
MGQLGKDRGAAWEPDLKLDVIEHIAGRLKLAMDRYFFELIGRSR